jgi:hypothetical protein
MVVLGRGDTADVDVVKARDGQAGKRLDSDSARCCNQLTG